MVKLTHADRVINRQRAKVVAKGYEEEMLAAYRRGDYTAARTWRDCADVAWRAAETGDELY